MPSLTDPFKFAYESNHSAIRTGLANQRYLCSHPHHPACNAPALVSFRHLALVYRPKTACSSYDLQGDTWFDHKGVLSWRLGEPRFRRVEEGRMAMTLDTLILIVVHYIERSENARGNSVEWMFRGLRRRTK